ncbi:hypothetical protein WJX84_002701 [Apatococcus fuscideae]|uniref:Uncharacterized protein n=1 Tax=Apatococcus fuscideae TaxID=2026836 RepID=A0AAW1T869_9CHLO
MPRTHSRDRLNPADRLGKLALTKTASEAPSRRITTEAVSTAFPMQTDGQPVCTSSDGRALEEGIQGGAEGSQG